MTITEWDEKRRCFCQSTNAVPAIARPAPPTRLQTNRTTGLNPSNTTSNTPPRNPPPPTVNPHRTTSNTSFNSTNTTAGGEQLIFRNTTSNTPPRNPPPPTVNPRPTISNPSSSSRNTTPPSSSFTNPSSSSRTQGSSSLSGWGCGVAILVAIAAALSPGMSARFTAQFSQFSNNSTTQKNQQPQLTPKEVVKRYYQSATSNPEADLPFRSDAFQSYWKQKDQGNKTEEFFKQFQKVDVYSVQTLTQSSTNSKVRVWLKYVWKNNKTTCESQIMELIFAQSQGQWLIDKVSDVEYGLDCGK
ncbi:hypothetical protein [Microseira sp. BLCC-F43]|uniref:hypothetical protein n=1 Tax=Microseira sp. BLCC-F43 TaxID=3153602 RepID=UPI0035B78BDB